MSFCDSDHKSMPIVWFLTHNDSVMFWGSKLVYLDRSCIGPFSCLQWSRNDLVGEEWTSVTQGLQLLHMDQGSSRKVSSTVGWCGSIWLWHRLNRLFSTGVLVSNVHLCISGNIPGLSQCSVSTPYAGRPSLIWSIVPLWRILVHSVPPWGLGDTLC